MSEDVGKPYIEVDIVHFEAYGCEVAGENRSKAPCQVAVNREVLVGYEFGANVQPAIKPVNVGREIIRGTVERCVSPSKFPLRRNET